MSFPSIIPETLGPQNFLDKRGLAHVWLSRKPPRTRLPQPSWFRRLGTTAVRPAAVLQSWARKYFPRWPDRCSPQSQTPPITSRPFANESVFSTALCSPQPLLRIFLSAHFDHEPKVSGYALHVSTLCATTRLPRSRPNGPPQASPGFPGPSPWAPDKSFSFKIFPATRCSS